MGAQVGPRVISSNLVLALDAGNTLSYPGTGSVWYDHSGNTNNFNIVAGLWNSGATSGTLGYMNINGSFGMAKNNNDIVLSDSTGITYFVICRIRDYTGDWRTLTRSYVSDHQVIIGTGGNNLGMYDNSAGGFIDTGYAVTNIPNFATTQWQALYWRFQSSSPYYKFSYFDTPGTIRASLTDANSRYQNGFGAIGGYHSESKDPSVGSQFWGDIGMFYVYNRALSDSELLQNYNAVKSRFDLG
jgi:hypothetical protein